MAVQGTSKSASSTSGIQKLADGKSVIPASTRADGSVRKEIKIKPGYRPPEDVEVYKNRTAEAWKNRGKGGVPGAEAVEDNDTAQQKSAAATKNAKRREARKRATENTANGDETAKSNSTTTQAEADGKAEPIDPEVEKAKEARRLAKKLRQARELQDKKASGEGLLPEQLAKVIKINELVRQLDSLGFDSEGVAKDGTSAQSADAS